MEAFIAFCEANSLNPLDKTSQKAFEESGKDPSDPKRGYKATTVDLWALGTSPDGEVIFREATGIAKRSREHATSVLRWQMETEEGATGVRVGVLSEEL